MFNKFDFDKYLQLIEELKAKAIDDITHKDLVRKVPMIESYRVLGLSEIQPIKITQQEIEQYEAKYRVKLPPFLTFLLKEIGQSRLTDIYPYYKGTIRPPETYVSDEMFVEFVKAGVKDEVLGLLEVYYDIETNIFKDPTAQDVFIKLGSDDDRHIYKLFYLVEEGYDNSIFIVLNTNGYGEIVQAGSWLTNPCLVNEKQYSNLSFRKLERGQDFLGEYCLKRLECRVRYDYYSVDDLQRLYG
jgi:hypothetical protein